MRNQPKHTTNHTNEAAMPRWFRRGLIVITTLMLCSCRVSDQAAYGQESGWSQSECTTCDSNSLSSKSVCAGSGSGGCQTCVPGQACGPAGRLVGPTDEYLCDGDDFGHEAAVEHDGTLVGFGQEDTIAHYETVDGRLLVVPSTRVCIYAPRFGSVRQVIQPMGAKQRFFIGAVGESLSLAKAEENQIVTSRLQNISLHERLVETPSSVYRGNQQVGVGVMLRALAITKGSMGPHVNLKLIRLGEYVGREKAIIAEHSLSAITWTGDQQVQIVLEGQGASALFTAQQPGLIYQTDEPNRPKLRLVKLASTDAAHPGDIVEFTLRYDNVGDAPIRSVALIDNLTTRLAYVDDSAKSSRDAEFATAHNDAGSLVLRWKLDGELPAGEGGVIHFKARVR